MTRLALITGASAGIGLETCALFAEKGYRVIALSRQPSGVESADLELALDLESFDEIEGLAGKMETEIAAAERVILVNNSGYGQFGALRDLSESMWQKQFSTHVFGPIKLAAVCLRLCEQQGVPLRVIAVSSVLSIAPQQMKGAYCAAKSAMNAAHESFWFDEQGSKSLESVSLVLPGPVKTRFREHALAALQPVIGRAGTAHQEKYEALASALAPGARIKPFTASASDVAKKIVRAAEAARPKPRYLVTPQTYAAEFITRFLPRSIQRIILR
ncbi:oxidoreductase, short-chain dehydrogenase/reductase family protein [Marinobacter santoriniensis NKSG1]|uniref:Oxidoreductase, short-chain dehydrogenase/reductase family protein n=1 Tax=Marinobacter santoriniensis NKSG1 TaxID=1288826 RepID=M7CUF8_9GAMM|nr:SDR family NAD(P)-dependent oxidoreductase [Marinobacter santoriniensis]EMP56754.1 oxidoreductase, short-chain dehydrogenase/reductase family protein [Marinobacter santoriniensis NKSG1]